jgi:glutathione peroxidase
MSALVLCMAAASMLGGVTGPSPDEKKADQDRPAVRSIYDLEVQDIQGQPVKLSAYSGKVLLIVNVASKCGLTDRNYKKLQPLYERYREQGLRILAFPANNFGRQEPGSNAEIKKFCRTKYNATYDLFAKVSVSGDDICPLYKFLTEGAGQHVAGKVQWNFQKYLVGRDGKVLAVFDPRTDPDDKKLIAKIEEALQAEAPSADPQTDES